MRLFAVSHVYCLAFFGPYFFFILRTWQPCPPAFCTLSQVHFGMQTRITISYISWVNHILRPIFFSTLHGAAALQFIKRLFPHLPCNFPLLSMAFPSFAAPTFFFLSHFSPVCIASSFFGVGERMSWEEEEERGGAIVKHFLASQLLSA